MLKDQTCRVVMHQETLDMDQDTAHHSLVNLLHAHDDTKLRLTECVFHSVTNLLTHCGKQCRCDKKLTVW